MSDHEFHPFQFRSPLLMNRDDSALVIIDVQEKLLPAIAGQDRIVWNIGRLIQAAIALDVRIAATEQYPKGLGQTVPSLLGKLHDTIGPVIPDKTMFSCRECIDTFEELAKSGIRNLLVTGIETHVCVAQSALDFLSSGFNVYVCVDAVGSRSPLDHRVGIRRMESSGVLPTTTEAAMFEWCEKAGSDEFKTISKIVQQQSP